MFLANFLLLDYLESHYEPITPARRDYTLYITPRIRTYVLRTHTHIHLHKQRIHITSQQILLFTSHTIPRSQYTPPPSFVVYTVFYSFQMPKLYSCYRALVMPSSQLILSTFRLNVHYLICIY